MAVSIEREIGYANTNLVGWSTLYDVDEKVAELQYPVSINTYHQMRNDSQLAGLLRAFINPILNMRWYVDPNGASDEVTEFISQQINLPIAGGDNTTTRARGRFDHNDHLYHALLAIVYGHMFFEQVYRIENEKVNLRKLAPRMPSTISKIEIAADGGIEYIQQFTTFNTETQRIPIDRLVVYVNEKEGGNWIGRSLLRSSYKNWLLKDRLLRVDAMKQERNGIGVPIVEAPPNATPDQVILAQQLTQQYKAGAASGGVLPSGFKLRLIGTEGSLPDTLASIRYHDEQMARSVLAMFMQLGSTETGSRALGEEFTDFFALAQESLAKNYASVFNQHVIEDLVDWNWSPNENAPIIKFESAQSKKLSVSELTSLVSQGVITVDPELENFVRNEYSYPDKNQNQNVAPVSVLHTPPQPETVAAAAPGAVVVGNREPNEIEIVAGTDFNALNEIYTSSFTALLEKYQAEVKPLVVQQVAEQIVNAKGDWKKLHQISVNVGVSDVLLESFESVAQRTLNSMIVELEHQGVELGVFKSNYLDDIVDQMVDGTSTIINSNINNTVNTFVVRNAGVEATQLAAMFEQHFMELEDKVVGNTIKSSVSQVQNITRNHVQDEYVPSRVYASEILDSSTCKVCGRWDEHEFDDYKSAREQYPMGHNMDCEGGSNCRGLLVGVYNEAEATR